MLEGLAGQHAAARRALDEALLDQIGLDDLLERVARLAEGGGDGFDADRAAIVEFGNGGEVAPIELVEADPSLGRRLDGAPAYLILLDSLVARDPGNAELLGQASRLNSAYAASRSGLADL